MDAALGPPPGQSPSSFALAAAGIPEIEVGSFVPASVLPQLADTAELVSHARSIAGLSVGASQA